MLIQGGYYPQTYIIAGICSALLLMVRSKKLTYTSGQPALLLLAALYVISSVVNGMSYSVISKAMLPLALFVLAALYATVDKVHREKLLRYITAAGILTSAAGLLVYFGINNQEALVVGNSLMFTFQYANAAGCWYAVCFILALLSDKKYVKYLSVLCLAALICTKSYGAVIVTVVMLGIHGMRSEWFKGKISNIKYVRFIIAALAVVTGCAGIYVLYRLGMESLLERVIHSYDGIRVLMSNVVCGIGPDNWQYVFPFYQTAYYPAGVIHNSYVQAGVDAGLMSMIILLALLVLVIYKYKKCRNAYNLAAVVIMVHSVMEYNLYFAGLDVLLIFLALYEPLYEKDISKKIHPPISIISGICIVFVMSFSLYGIGKIRKLELYIRNDDTAKATEVYADNEFFMKNGYRECEDYGVLALANGIDYIPDKVTARYRRYEMIYSSDISIAEIIDYIEEQKNYKNVRIEAAKLVKKLDVPDEQKKYYYSYVSSIDDSVAGWFGRIMGHQ